MIQKVGNNSMIFEKSPVILAASSVVGEKKRDRGLLGSILTMWRKTRSLAWRHGSRQRVPCS